MSDSKPATLTASSGTSDTSAATPSRKRGSRDKEDEETLAVLNAFLDFKNQHDGSNPTPTTILPILDVVNPTLHHRITTDQLYNEFRHLKSNYNKLAEAGGPSARNHPFDATFFDLAAKIWGVKSSDPEEKGPRKVKVENENIFEKDHHLLENGTMDDHDEEEDKEEEGDVDEEEEGSNDDDDDDRGDDDVDAGWRRQRSGGGGGG